MIGGGGNDIYNVDDAADIIIEDADNGFSTDQVSAFVSYALGGQARS